MQDAVSILCEIRDAMLKNAHEEHGRELAERAFVYALNRIRDGSAKTVQEAKHAMGAFADGFCTGYHRGNGTTCQR